MNQQILLIDDSDAIHKLVASLLADEPVTIHSAHDGQFGLAQAASLRPDLILLDVEMPVMDGYETCRRLRADAATATLPIIFLTARATTDELVRGLDLGANDYVTKPFKLSELLSRVRATLRTSRLIRLLEERALIDALTGLGNRAMFEKRLAAEVALRARSGSPLSCAALSVDRFDDLVARYGRPFGDHVLGAVGRALTAVCPVEAVACRVGGNSFAVLVPQGTAEMAAALAGQVCAAVAKTPFARQSVSITVTCSAGVAEAGDLYDRSMLGRAEASMTCAADQAPARASVAVSMPAARIKAA